MNQPMRLLTTLALIGIICPMARCAETTTAQNRAHAERYIQSANSELARQNTRRADLADEMIRIDADIEQRINEMVDMVASVRDSSDSKTRVVRAKEDALDALKASIKVYQTVREQQKRLLKNAYQPQPAEATEKTVDALDARIDKRIDQIIEISHSFTEHKDYKKYKRYSGGHVATRRGNYVDPAVDLELRREYKDDVRQAEGIDRIAVDTKEAIVKGLRGSIDKITKDNERLLRELKLARSETQRAAIKKELADNDAVIKVRREQLSKALAGGAAPATRAISTDAALSIDDMIEDYAARVEKDTRRLITLKGQRDQIDSTIRVWQARVAKAEKYLVDLASAND